MVLPACFKLKTTCDGLNMSLFMFADCSSPTVGGMALSPTSANIAIKPPGGGPWDRYRLTLCPVGGPAGGCVVVTCPTTSCPVNGLKPETSYVVQVSAWSNVPFLHTQF